MWLWEGTLTRTLGAMTTLLEPVVDDKPGGLLLMEAIRDGLLDPPPAALVLGLEIDDVREGEITFVFNGNEMFSNGTSTHGGILAAVADFAASTAVLTGLGAGAEVVTTNLQVTYLRPVPTDDHFRCTGRAVYRGNTLHHAEAVMTNKLGHEVLRATATLHVRQ